jgi:hypothetical protein
MAYGLVSRRWLLVRIAGGSDASSGRTLAPRGPRKRWPGSVSNPVEVRATYV